jgi:hypothetical protein
MRWIAAFVLTVTLLGAPGSALAWENRPGDWTPGSVLVSRTERAVSLEFVVATAIEPVVPMAIEPVVPIEPAIDVAAFRITVPFRTQKDGSAWQGSNCGPAILGMILDGFGLTGQSTDDLRFRAHTYQGTVGMRTGTALDHIAHVAEDFGVRTYGLYGGNGQWRSWGVDDIREQLKMGRPVVPLVRLYLLPTYENSLPRWGHYVLITGMNEEGFFYSDPLQLDARSGTGGYMSADRLMRAMHASHIPGQAVAFGGSTMLSWHPAG